MSSKMSSNLDPQKFIHRIAEIIIEELKLEDVTADTFNADVDLINDLGIDSMDLTAVVLVLQDEYQLKIKEDDYPKLSTVRLIAQYLENKLQSNERSMGSA
jgi:acyl carrier protein